MESLQRKAFHFLKATTNLQNITERVFGTFAAEHADVGKWYDEYFTDHWDEIRKLQEHEQSMARLEEDDNVDYRHVMKKFRKMLQERK
jgi:predicted choloylglycine hydrolase